MDEWQPEEFLQELTGHLSERAARIAQKILDWGEENGRLVLQPKQKGIHTGYEVVLPRQGAGVTLFKLTVGGKIQWQSGYDDWALHYLPFTTDPARSEFVRRFRKSGVKFPTDPFVAKNVRTKGPKMDVTDVDNVSVFLEALDWVVEQVKKANGESA